MISQFGHSGDLFDGLTWKILNHRDGVTNRTHGLSQPRQLQSENHTTRPYARNIERIIH